MASPLGKMVVDLESSPPPSPAQWTVGMGNSGSGASSSSSSEVAAALAAAEAAAPCSICLEPVQGAVGRATAKLHCGHEFHLDCIGSAFNVKGAMQCPNCRKIENGRWLYKDGHGPAAPYYDTNWIDGTTNDLVPDLPAGFDSWLDASDIEGYTNAFLASMFGGTPEADQPSQPLSNHMSGNHSGAGSSSQAYPQLSVRDLRLPAHVPSSSASSGAEGASLQHNPTGLEGHAAPAALGNAQALHASESRNLDGEHQYSGLSASSFMNRAMASFASRAPQGLIPTSSQQRSRPYIVHHYPVFYRFTHQNGSNLGLGAPLGSAPTAMAETRLSGHGHGASAQLYQQAMMHYHLQSNPSPPATTTSRRVRPRATALESFLAAAPSGTSSGTGRAHEFAALPAATMNTAALNMSLSSSNGGGPTFRPPVAAPSHGWGREAGVAGYPVAAAAGETTPQWWTTFMSSFQNQSPNVSQNLNLNRAPPGRLAPRSAAAGAGEPMPPQGSQENGRPPSSSRRRSPSQ